MTLRLRPLTVVSLASLLAACAGPATGPALPRYVCEYGLEFSVRFVDDTAVLDGTRGREVLYRDAGGLTPQHTVYSNPRMKAEFGLGATGREAIVRYPLLPLAARCARD